MNVRPISRIALAIVAPLTFFAAQISVADPVPYRFISIYSENSPVNSFGIVAGSINNNGVLAVAMGNPQVVYRVDGLVWTAVWEAAVGSGDSFNQLDINDNEQIGGVLNSGLVRTVVRLESDGTAVTLATRVFQCPGPNDFCNFGNLGDGLNNAGQIALTGVFDHGVGPVNSVWLFDDGGPIEIARQDAVNAGGLSNFSVPSVNDPGVVAFGAQEADGSGGASVANVYTGTGGLPVYQGTPTYPFGGGISYAIINDDDVIGLNAGSGIFTLDSGIFTTIVAPAFNASSLGPVSFNNRGDIAFRGEVGGVAGIFTGGNAVDDVVLQVGDALFGGTVPNSSIPTGAFRFTENALNDRNDILFKVQIDVGGQPVSHLVRAIPMSADFDSEGDGAANDVDNCLIASNSLQRDTDGDNFGNACDADLNNDNVVDFGDLPPLQNAFFSQDGDPNWNPDADLNGDGVMDFADLPTVLGLFFGPPGPSALVP